MKTFPKIFIIFSLAVVLAFSSPALAATNIGTNISTDGNLTVGGSSTLGTIISGIWNGSAIGPTYGGTGLISYLTGDMIYASAANILSKLGIGTPGQVLTVAGGVPTWATSPSAPVTSVFGRTGDVVAASNDYTWAQIDKTTSSLADITTRNISDTTGTLTETRGGTNQTTYAIGDILYASGANTLSKLSAGSDGEVLTLASGVPSWATPAGGGTVGGSGTLNFIPKWTPDGSTLGNSLIFDDGTNVGIGTAVPSSTLDILQPVATSGSPTGLTFTGGAHTGLSNATVRDVFFNLDRVVNFIGGGAIFDQIALYINRPTYTANSAQTIEVAATAQVDGVPLAGSNVTIDEAYAFIATGQTTKANITNTVAIDYANIAGSVGNLDELAALNIFGTTVGLGNQTATLADLWGIRIGQSTFESTTNTRTVTNAAGLYIEGNPIAGANVTFTNPPVALWVGGDTKLNGLLRLNNDPGTAGQILTSAGAGAPPTWATPTAGSTSFAQTDYHQSTPASQQVISSSTFAKITTGNNPPTTGTSTFIQQGGVFDDGGANDLSIKYIGTDSKYILFKWHVVVRRDAAADGTIDVRMTVGGTTIDATRSTTPVDANHGGTASGQFIRLSNQNEEFELYANRLPSSDTFSDGGTGAVEDVVFTAEVL